MTNSRRKLASAEDLMVNGSMKVTRMYKMRERLEGVRVLLQSTKDVRDMFHAMRESIHTGDTCKAAQYALTLLQTLQIEAYEQLDGIQGYGSGVQELIPVIRQRTDKVLYRICSRKFSADEYGQSLMAYLLLDQMRESLGVQIITRFPSNDSQNNDVDGDVLHDTFGCMEGLCPRIHRYLVADVTVCVRTALIEHIHTLHVRRSDNSHSSNHNHNQTSQPSDNSVPVP
eukprot:gene1435-1866_t